MRVLLVSSAGGVLLDMLALEPWWSTHEPVWVAVRAVDTVSALGGQRVHWVRETSVRAPLSVVPATLTAWRMLRAERPSIVVSAGSGVAVPFFCLAKLLGITSFWLSTFNVLTTQGISDKLCGRLASRVLLQRRESLTAHPTGLVIGELY